MISLDYTILLQMLLFLLLWVVLSRILFRPYLSLLEEREKRTEGAQDESFALEQEGQRLRALYEDGLAKARAAGEAVKAREEAAETLERMRLEIRNELAREREMARREAEAIAQDMVAKVLGRRAE